MADTDEKRRAGWKLAAVGALICMGGLASCKTTDVPANERKPGGADVPFRKPVEPATKESAAKNESLGAAQSNGSARQLVALGGALVLKGNYSEAEAVLRRAIELDPKSVVAHGTLGEALLEQGKLAEGEAAFRRAVELDPNLAAGHFQVGTALGDQGKFAEAEVSLRRAVELDPELAVAHNNLGVALEKQGKHAEAAESFRRAEELKSGR